MAGDKVRCGVAVPLAQRGSGGERMSSFGRLLLDGLLMSWLELWCWQPLVGAVSGDNPNDSSGRGHPRRPRRCGLRFFVSLGMDLSTLGRTALDLQGMVRRVPVCFPQYQTSVVARFLLADIGVGILLGFPELGLVFREAAEVVRCSQ